MKFKDNFKRICNERGTTPTALLRNMGITTSKVTMWNKGALPKEDMLLRLAKELNCSVMDFFMDEETLTAPEPTDVAQDEDEHELLRIFRKLGRRARHEFMAVAYEYERDAGSQEEDND